MINTKSLIKAFQSTLAGFEFSSPSSYSESFAIARFKKKFQVPTVEASTSLKEECWNQWINFDHELPKGEKYFFEVFQRNPKFWFNVREKIRKNLTPCRFSDKVDFSPGSTFTPTRGRNSTEAKLSSLDWDCTDDNFDAFARICYSNNALKKAARHKWIYFNKSRGYSVIDSERVLYRHAVRNPGNGESIGFRIFKLKLRLFLPKCRGSRFVSIPKNNETRRPINVEPFCNVIVQKQIGSHLRNEIKRIFKEDLDTLSIKHNRRISDSNVATIDLKNASDAFSLALCKFLLPSRLYEQLVASRSPFILGPDKSYYLVNKISAMGNGFTFELMSTILFFVCRELDPNATVFGDDIIIAKTKAKELISFLKEMGLVVNIEKSFIDGPFRESCGGNFHDEEGYIKSYDFVYPESINDCIVIYNKCHELREYPNFDRLRTCLFRHIPPALRGGAHGDRKSQIDLHTKSAAFISVKSVVELDNFFCCGSKTGKKVTPRIDKKIKRRLKSLDISGPYTVFTGFTSKVRERTPVIEDMISHLHWAKYLMYLHAGRKTPDAITGDVTWIPIDFITVDERTFRLSSLLNS